jgi:hypothetical protein
MSQIDIMPTLLGVFNYQSKFYGQDVMLIISPELLLEPIKI